ncbi:MAG: hypothetical protein AB7I98_03025 [Verrucomicrobiales bacterium]
MLMFTVRAAGGGMADEDFAMGVNAGLPGRRLSDSQIREVIGKIRADERAADQIKQCEERKRREEEQRIEAKRRAAERAAEEARRKPIMEERVQNRQCRYCGSALGFFDKIFKRTNHKKCREQNGTF